MEKEKDSLKTNKERVADACVKLNLTLEDKQYEQFIKYYELLIEWNQVMNLTAITEFGEVLTKHFIDSLSLANEIDLKKDLSIIDVGTGAGFPGIPLKIVYPSLNIVLLDSLNKRIKFLDAVINQLGLKGIKAVHGRAEEFGRNNEYREQFDLCLSRAVANLATLSEYCVPFIKMGGYFISYKSGEAEEEIENSKNAVKLLGGKIDTVKTFILPDTDISRSFVFIKKELETSKKYPRNAGKPSKEPLH